MLWSALRWRTELRSIRELAAHLEWTVFPSLRAQDTDCLHLLLLPDGRFVGETPRACFELPQADGLRPVLKRGGVQRVHLDSRLEKEQILRAFIALMHAGPVARNVAPRDMPDADWRPRHAAAAMRSNAGWHQFCADLKLDVEAQTFTVEYSYCELFFSNAIRRYVEHWSRFKDHRALFHLAPRAALAVFLVLQIPWVVLPPDHPYLRLLLFGVAALMAGVVWMGVHGVGALLYTREHHDVLLRENLERIRALSRFPEANPNVVIKLDRFGEVLYCNPRAVSVLECLRKEEAPVTVLLPPDYLQIIEDCLENAPKVVEMEHTIDVLTFRFTFSAFPNEDSVIVAGTNISQLKTVERELREKNRQLEEALERVRATQQQLIVSEKMASLGALTAGIAHEIKNPLNFVNNFAEVSLELATELETLLSESEETLPPERRREAMQLLADLRQNAERIHKHGKRADSIVRGMLLHSRGRPGQWEDTDINNLADEFVSLAYHGMRAQDSAFSVAIETHYDPDAGAIPAVAQNLSRAILNIANNAIQAAQQKKNQAGAGFQPAVSVSTRGLPDQVELRIRDNGTGIPPEIRGNIFNPFFTSKPAGEGTGLGLSTAYETIVEEHGGQLEVDSEPGEFSEFIIRLPRNHAEESGA